MPSSATTYASRRNIASLTAVPQEILLQVAKQLRILDVFVLRQVCRDLHVRLSGVDNQPLYYYFLNNPSFSSAFTASSSSSGNRNRKRKRFPRFDKDTDYYAITKNILSGRTEGCGICLAEVKNGGFVAYKGRVLFKRVCGSCARGYFTEIWRLEDTHPNLKIHPSQRITWSSENGNPFDEPGSTQGRWLSSLPRDCVLTTELQSAVLALPPSSSTCTSSSKRTNVAKQAYHSRYDKQIHFALQRKEAADIVIKILTEEYQQHYKRLHWLKPPHAFEEYTYNSLLWNLRPWLAPHYGHEKGLPRFMLGDKVEEILELYTESEELLDELRITGVRNACKSVMESELGVPKAGKDLRKPGKMAPLVRHWIVEWLKIRGYKGVPKDTKKDLRNSPRVCPFCKEEGEGKRGRVTLGSTMALTVHVWCRHEEMLEEDWRWLPVSN
ncbi:hypothetical protein TWF718_009321 [Orbilia javanica]|uniref:F-box domain-containing protein n=1 Tax=Orbilia javanica TaxID=47235 RepID=A0AAN8NST1_9PEZI